LEDEFDDELKIEIMGKKDQVIKDIQTFNEIISISLKLFYSKLINYQIFRSEKDEFINIICYFLFNY
jgi:hypothetical protein